MARSSLSCTQHSHNDFKKTYETFREATRHVAYDRIEGLILANCKLCGSTLTIPLAWENPERAYPRQKRDRVAI